MNFDRFYIFAIKRYEKLKARRRIIFYWILFEIIVALLAIIFLPEEWIS
jgi:hypothetical protein